MDLCNVVEIQLRGVLPPQKPRHQVEAQNLILWVISSGPGVQPCPTPQPRPAHTSEKTCPRYRPCALRALGPDLCQTSAQNGSKPRPRAVRSLGPDLPQASSQACPHFGPGLPEVSAQSCPSPRPRPSPDRGPEVSQPSAQCGRRRASSIPSAGCGSMSTREDIRSLAAVA